MNSLSMQIIVACVLKLHFIHGKCEIDKQSKPQSTELQTESTRFQHVDFSSSDSHFYLFNIVSYQES